LKRTASTGDTWDRLRLVDPKPETTAAKGQEAPLDVSAIYAQHAQFLWRSLSRAGVADDDLPDSLQEVLLVVHRRLGSFDGSCRLTTWLFGICLRVAATTRRTRRRRREDPMDVDTERKLVERRDPEELALARDARRRLNVALDRLDPEKRAVLVMFELEGLACGEIAELLGVPKGTVFSRLANARQLFLAALQRLELSEQRVIQARQVHDD
jgi:RNA polymerase sigma-70 factor, ECF subfamily